MTLFAEVGMGAGHIRLRVLEVEILGFDFEDEIEDLIEEEASTTKLLFAFGGGVNVSTSETTSLDAGFRYTRIATEDPAINSAMVYAAFKFGP